MSFRELESVFHQVLVLSRSYLEEGAGNLLKTLLEASVCSVSTGVRSGLVNLLEDGQIDLNGSDCQYVEHMLRLLDVTYRWYVTVVKEHRSFSAPEVSSKCGLRVEPCPDSQQTRPTSMCVHRSSNSILLGNTLVSPLAAKKSACIDLEDMLKTLKKIHNGISASSWSFGQVEVRLVTNGQGSDNVCQLVRILGKDACGAGNMDPPGKFYWTLAAV